MIRFTQHGTTAVVLLVATSLVHAIPMGSGAARHLPQLQALITKARAKSPLSQRDIDALYSHLRQGEPALVSLAAWTLGAAQPPEARHVETLREIGGSQNPMAAAFIKIAIVRLSSKTDSDRATELGRLAKDDSPYLKLEAARALIEFDQPGAKELLRKLVQNQHFTYRAEAAEVLKRIDPSDQSGPFVPVLESRYHLVLSMIEPRLILATHAISGQTRKGNVPGPFPSETESLMFDWKLAPDALPDGVEIRWIAADTGGVAPNDTVITTGKSDAGKTEGIFTLSRPTSGFPPGRYRIEIWQSGKMIHSEVFEIKK